MPQQEHRKNSKEASLKEKEHDAEEEKKTEERGRETLWGKTEEAEKDWETVLCLTINLHCQILHNKRQAGCILYCTKINRVKDWEHHSAYTSHIRLFVSNISCHFWIMNKCVFHIHDLHNQNSVSFWNPWLSSAHLHLVHHSCNGCITFLRDCSISPDTPLHLN